jgi:ferrous iron transport protein B
VGAFFAENEGLVLFSIYLMGIVLAVIMGKVFSATLLKGERSHFIMELPPYRMPTWKGTAIHMWERGSGFLRRAGTLIVGVVVLGWVLASMPFGVEYASPESVLGAIGTFIAPVLEPLGFGNWQAAVSLIFGFLAKETVVGTLGTVYGIGEEGLIVALQQAWTPLTAYAFMAMVLIYVPCMAVVATIRRETNSWKMPALTIAYTITLGWLMAFLIYQGGRLIGFN